MRMVVIFSAFSFFFVISSASSIANNFTDGYGNPIIAPEQKVSNEYGAHPQKEKKSGILTPEIKSRKLVQGLETTRILTILVPTNELKETSKDLFPVKAIYIVDNAREMIGYIAFSEHNKQAFYQTKINGIINYIEIYVEYRNHGVWYKKIPLN